MGSVHIITNSFGWGFISPQQSSWLLLTSIKIREKLQYATVSHRFSQEVWGFPVDVPLEQSIDLRDDQPYIIYISRHHRDLGHAGTLQ